MWCYYNQADEVELFVNGKSQGVKCKDADGNSTGRYLNMDINTDFNKEQRNNLIGSIWSPSPYIISIWSYGSVVTFL